MNFEFSKMLAHNSDLVNQIIQSAMDQLFDKYKKTNMIEVKFEDTDYSTNYQLHYDVVKGFYAIIEALDLDFVPFFPIIVPDNLKSIFIESIVLTDTLDELTQEINTYELYLRMKLDNKRFLSFSDIEKSCSEYLQISLEELTINDVSKELSQKRDEMRSLKEKMKEKNIVFFLLPQQGIYSKFPVPSDYKL